MSTDSHHKGQLLVVDGSASGDYFITTKSDYNSTPYIKYLGECKRGTEDDVNKHFIQKFIYDSNFNLVQISIAINQSTLVSDNVNVFVVNQYCVRITLNTGDAEVLNIDDGFRLLVPGTYDIRGFIKKKESSTSLIVELTNGTSGIVNANNVSVIKENLYCTLENDKTKDYLKRRWDHRDRYFYV